MNKKGFTLVEIMVAVTIFAVVMIISMSIFLKSFTSQRRIIEMQKIQREGFYIMEIMSRKIRMATIIEPQSLDYNESTNQDSSFYFTNSDGEEIEFCRSDEDGICNDDDTGDYIAFGLESQTNKDLATSSDVKVENLRFFVPPEESGKSQYVVTIDLDLASAKNPEVKINLQNTISTRIYSDGVIGGGPSGSCGDGVVQDPNGDGDSEICDNGAANTNTPCNPGCSDECTYCDTSCQLQTVNRDTDWIVGVCSGIGVRFEDAPTIMAWGPDAGGDSCGDAGICDGDGVIISGLPLTDYADFPAAEYCESIGGRLPSLGELECMYANRTTIGGFSVTDPAYYWSNKSDRCATGLITDYNGYGVDKMNFYTSNFTYAWRPSEHYVRCVKDVSCITEIAPPATCGNGVDGDPGEECDYSSAAYNGGIDPLAYDYYPIPYPIDERCFWRDTWDFSHRYQSGRYCDKYCINHEINANDDAWATSGIADGTPYSNWNEYICP